MKAALSILALAIASTAMAAPPAAQYIDSKGKYRPDWLSSLSPAPASVSPTTPAAVAPAPAEAKPFTLVPPTDPKAHQYWAPAGWQRNSKGALVPQ